MGSENDSGCFKILNSEDWERKMFLNCGSLLGRSCSSCLELSGRNEELKNSSFQFGSNISSALTMSQVLRHKSSNQTSMDLSYLLPDFQVSMEYLEKRISDFTNLALWNLNAFPDCQAVASLSEITHSVKEMSLL